METPTSYSRIGLAPVLYSCHKGQTKAGQRELPGLQCSLTVNPNHFLEGPTPFQKAEAGCSYKMHLHPPVSSSE